MKEWNLGGNSGEKLERKLKGKVYSTKKLKSALFSKINRETQAG
jgi:hypothetical protein